VSQPNFVKKVVFPLEVLPIVSTTIAAIHSLGAIIILLIVAAFLVNGIFWTIFWVIPFILILFILACGLSWLLSSLGVFFRDLSSGTQLAVQFLFFLTPITYSLDLVPKQVMCIYRLNPLVGIVEGLRGAVLYGHNPSFGMLVYPFVFAVVSMVIGFYSFQRCRRTFADVI
jgi:lipopolysaccharide transport system permease protein